VGKRKDGTPVSWDQLYLVDGVVRPIWRFLIAAAMIVFAHLSVGVFLGMTFEAFRMPAAHYLLWASCLVLVTLLASFKILAGAFEGKPLGSIGLAFCGRWKSELAIGVTLGAAMILAVAAMEWGLSLARFTWNFNSAGQVFSGGAYYGLLFAAAATNEELAFRGYPFQRLVEAFGPVAAVGISSLFFGLVHLGNPSHTWLSTCNTALVGVPLAVAYLRTRALWLPIGMHFAWNFFQSYTLGLEVSGMQFSGTLLKPDVHGSLLLTGGNYGPEGGVLATGVIVVATLYLLFSRSIYTNEDRSGQARGKQAEASDDSGQTVASAVSSTPSAKMNLRGVN
jgi:membrane protease YdiL (CAAX protease family)